MKNQGYEMNISKKLLLKLGEREMLLMENTKSAQYLFFSPE